MAKMFKHLVFGQRKNPPAPPRPDYGGDKICAGEEEEEEPFSEHNYENISRFRCRVRFGDHPHKELLVFENYSEPADLRSEISALEEALYVAPLDDCCTRPTAPPLLLQEEEEEDVYCVPYDAPPSPQAIIPEDATYDVVPEDDNGEEVVEYDEPWEWSVGARLTHSLQVSPTLEEEEEDEAMRRQRRLLYETAFDSRVNVPDEVGGACVAGSSRAASRSSFGSSTGSSASSTPTHRNQRHLAVQVGSRSTSPPQSRPPLNQNFERKISFSPQWCFGPHQDNGSHEESPSDHSPGGMEHQVARKGAEHEDVKVDGGCSVIHSTQDDHPEHHKENNDRCSPALPQSPDNDVRPCVDYDLPWDAAHRHNNTRPLARVNGSKSVPEKLSVSHGNAQEEGDEKPTAAGVGQQAKPSLGNLGSNKGRRLTLDFGCSALGALGERVDPQLSLEKQEWYHGSISRVDAESKLRVLREGSYLVRNSESSRQDYSLSLKSARGFMHMKIVATADGRFVLGQFSNPFASIPEMIQHYSLNKLPIKGAEHMSLLHPCIEQLL